MTDPCDPPTEPPEVPTAHICKTCQLVGKVCEVGYDQEVIIDYVCPLTVDGVMSMSTWRDIDIVQACDCGGWTD